MIRAYNEYYLGFIKKRLASMFEIAVVVKGIDIDKFAEDFLASDICSAFERADPVFVMGKSSVELFALIEKIEQEEIIVSEYATPEYWVGWTLAYVQWYLNVPYVELIRAIPCSELIQHYFPYHEMDISKSVELFQKVLPRKNKLKQLRKIRKFTQRDLALLSGIPERTIKSYEQGKVDISKASVETVQALSRELGCTIEDLVL